MSPVAVSAESGVLASVCLMTLKCFGEVSLQSGGGVWKDIKAGKKDTLKLSLRARDSKVLLTAGDAVQRNTLK